MTFERLDAQFNAALAQQCSSRFSEELRQVAISNAIREYSRYRPQKRRMGTGVLSGSVSPGATKIYLFGGPFTAGSEIQIGLGVSRETRTILSVLPDNRSDLSVGNGIAVTVAALANDHLSGEYVSLTVPCFTTTASVDTYELPLDFLEPDIESLDIAIGNRARVRKQGGFYDAAYGNANAYNGPTPNPSLNYGGQPSRFSNPNMGAFQGTAGEVVYRFIQGSRPMLVISPAPYGERKLDFWYRCTHTVETIPDSDIDALMHLCKAEAYMSRAQKIGGTAAVKEGDESYDGSKGASSLESLAASERKQFDKLIRNRPVAMGG